MQNNNEIERGPYCECEAPALYGSGVRCTKCGRYVESKVIRRATLQHEDFCEDCQQYKPCREIEYAAGGGI